MFIGLYLTGLKLGTSRLCEQPQEGVLEPVASEQEQDLPPEQLLSEQLHLESPFVFVAEQSLNAGELNPTIMSVAKYIFAMCILVTPTV